MRSPLIYKITEADPNVHLTFDDGPSAPMTLRILDLLQEQQVTASFFVIGDKARQAPAVIQRMIREGHGVFSHSIDHRYRYYFTGEATLKQWIQRSLQDLEQITGLEQKVFRPPAGVLTPPLIKAARSLQVPLVLWNHRFFDTARLWTQQRANASLRRIAAGDLILLHDHQRQSAETTFIETLKYYLLQLKVRGYSCTALSNKVLTKEVSQ